MTNPTTPQPSAYGGAGGQSLARPRVDVKRKDPGLEAVVKKLVSPDGLSNGGRTVTGVARRGVTPPNQALLQRISDQTTSDVDDAASMFQLLPDTELAMQILVSSILSPKDMVNTEINYYVEGNQFDSELSGEMLEVIRGYFEDTYKMGDLLPSILQDTLFLTGSYPLLVLPETSIDDAINSPYRVTMEKLRDDLGAPGSTNMLPCLGLLGVPAAKDTTVTNTVTFETLAQRFTGLNQAEYNPTVGAIANGFDPRLTVTDNPNLLKLPRLFDKLRQDRVQDVLSLRKLSVQAKRQKVSQENRFENTSAEDETSLYRRRRYKHQPITAITPGSAFKRDPIGHPLVMKVPSESVIPVHVPSNPEEHLGYFLLLDQSGNFLVRSNEKDYYTDMATQMNTNRNMVSQLINTTDRGTQGRDAYAVRQTEIEEMERTYGDLVEADLMSRLKSGVYGDNVQIARPTEVYRIMLSRAFAKMNTQVLYVPAEMMTYIAFDYNKFGIGSSLLANSKIIGGLRAMLLFANTMASVKNSINRTRLNITLDPSDPDPTTTVEFLLNEYAKTRMGSYPLGASSPLDIITYLQNAGIEVAVSGNTGYPETKFEVENRPGQHIKPDTELEKELRDRHLMSMGLSPETVDAGRNAEFATSVVNNNLLLTKRVLMYQNKLMPFLEDFVQKYTLNSGHLIDELREILRRNKDKLTKEQKEQAKKMEVDSKVAENDGEQTDIGEDAIIMEFIQAIRLSLPAPDNSTLENQMKAFDAYVEALEKTLKAYIDPSFLTNMGLGPMEEVLTTTLETVRAYFLRRWLRNNNVMPELDDLTTFDEENGPTINLLELADNHQEGLSKTILDFMKKLVAIRGKTDAAYQALSEKLGATETPPGEPDDAASAVDGLPADEPVAPGDDLATDAEGEGDGNPLEEGLDALDGGEVPAGDEPAEDTEETEEAPAADAAKDDDA